MKKLLQLNVTANWGSTGKIAEGIGLAAMARGWESAIAYGRYMNPSQSLLIKVGSQMDVYAHYAKNRFLDGEGLGSKRATRQLVKQIQELAPDIIHLHNIHDHWLNYPILFEYLASIDTPVVWTFHDCWAFTGGCFHFENTGCDKWKAKGCNGECIDGHKQAGRNFNLKRELITSLGRRLNVVAVSKWMADFAKKSFLRDANVQVNVINNGINLETFQPADKPKSKLILGVSNVWQKVKGLDDFVKLRAMLPDDVHITLVGLTEKQVNALPAGINGLTRTANASELAALYSEASVFVNPTYCDSFPTVNLEALACGTPVITYRTGGSPEAIDERIGIVVEKGDVDSLVKSINEILLHPENYDSGNCRSRAEKHFDKDIQFGKYIDLYEALLSRKANVLDL